jgi:hypothetical protein
MCLGIGWNPETILIHQACIMCAPDCGEDSTNNYEMVAGEGGW